MDINNKTKRLYKALEDYGKSDYYPCHMPGHKRNINDGFLSQALKYDITEIEGFDNLHAAEDVILESEQFAAKLYSSEETHFLVNGSTVGLLSAVLATTNLGDDIIISRNCHKAVYNAIEINRLKSHYIYPDIIDEFDLVKGIEAGDVSKLMDENPKAKVVVVVSPTYDGIVSDIASISDTVHKRNGILIVDEAHGAHFAMDDRFPCSSVQKDADIVIHSVHKTLPAPTQTALIHINGDRANREKIRRNLRIYQTSSPSYLLMAGIDNCMQIMHDKGKELVDNFLNNIAEFEKNAQSFIKLKYIKKDYLVDNYGIKDKDIGKVIISTKGSNITGKELYDLLINKYRIQPEMAAGSYCLLIMTVMDSKAGFDRLYEALKEIDEGLVSRTTDSINVSPIIKLTTKKDIYEAVNLPSEFVELSKAESYISADFVYVYPPGIPIIVPGELVTDDFVKIVNESLSRGLNVQGITESGKIKVVWEKYST